MEEDKEEEQKYGFVDELSPKGASRDPFGMGQSEITDNSGFKFLES
jgi:hypothetical protein